MTPEATDRADRLRQIEEDANTDLIDRETEVRLIILSILSKQNGLLIGEPGVAKSQTIRTVLSRITGAKKFEVLLGQATPPAAVLGPVSVKGLTEDKYEHITTDMLPEAHVAFLDEIFKSNSVTLNALLSVVNERVFHNGGTPQEIPLWSVIGASNELPTEANLQAFRDRLPWTRKVEPVRGDDGFKKVMLGNILRRKKQASGQPTVSLSIEEIEQMQKEVTEVQVTDAFMDALAQLKRRADKEGMRISARRYAAGVALCQAQALLDGRSKLAKSDLTLFEHILWLDPQDQPKAFEIASDFAGEIQRAVGRLTASLQEYTERFQQIKEGVQSTDQAAQSSAVSDGVNVLSDMRRLVQAIDRTLGEVNPDDGEDIAPIHRLKDKAEELREAMRLELLQ